MEPLLIPHAVDQQTLQTISHEDLADLDNLEISRMRTHATLAHQRGNQPIYQCPHCFGPLYPRGAVIGRRAHWAHYGSDRSPCPLDTRRTLTRDEVSGIIFRGRQEGGAHEKLRLLLFRLVSNDPNTEPGSATTDQYDKPEEGTGCYPDVRFRYLGRTFVLEAQLAPVSLSTIATRRVHYAKQRALLIWVVKVFDAHEFKRMFQWDLIAAQGGIMFAIDDEVVSLIEVDNRFRLRQFKYDPSNRSWKDSIVELDEIDLAYGGAPIGEAEQWARTFKRIWTNAFAPGGNVDLVRDLVADLFEKFGIKDDSKEYEFGYSYTVNVISTLISIERGEPVGYRQNLTHMLDRRAPGCFGGRCYKLFRFAVQRFQPELMSSNTVIKAFEKARERCGRFGLEPFDRHTHWGEIWKALWPDSPFD